MQRREGRPVLRIFDGYNLIGAGREHGMDLSLDDKEERLLGLLARYRSRRRVRERYLVVFDGDYGRLAQGPKKYMYRGIGVEWAIGESADDLILRRVASASNPRGLKVVSSDGAVVRGTRASGASTLSSSEFLHMVKDALGESDTVEKPSSPTAAEVEKWLEIFGEDKGRNR